MDIKSLVPAKSFAVNFGLKAVIYGGPGSGKTPVCVKTAPNPVLLLCEAGALTLKDSNVPTWPAFTEAKIDEFMTWFTTSAEAAKFDTLVIDSVTQMSEIILDKYLGGRSKAGNSPDGRKAYGEMARQTMEYLNKLYFMPRKHILLVSKQGSDTVMGMEQTRPIMPGKDLNVRIPHLVDGVFHMGIHMSSGVMDRVTLMCIGDLTTMARDRSGQLAQYEEPDMSRIIAKACAA